MPATAAFPADTARADIGRADTARAAAGDQLDGFSPSQREMLETGLRFVRSSLTMNVQEPTDGVVSERDAALSELGELERLLGMKPR